ncbi:HutD family protein [Colwellia sp. M166]|uniref:HutD/Ves family protein n=1 Tax=Colwellia sp. M166 TaxID=2583805 RepID=UPI00211E0E88|nr:HutD family protein [Colwellia sp. M166]UUO23867.1 HutD family protein [Colwellia sp. M166]|tara:strand:+ start:495 stop:1073 length:579 start_codon:yes stop_codon:yes gene_type:complete
MIEIIPPTQFKTVPWKNGQGETIEMLINPGGSLENFDWRLSMANVVEDGVFSNFSGYTRNLILIAGDGINLQHNDNKIDRLTRLLDISTFDGGDKTVGNLQSNEITDFNIITRTERITTKVKCYPQAKNQDLGTSQLCFIYSLFKDALLTINNDQKVVTLPAQHLMQITDLPENYATLTGDHLIVVYLSDCT